MCEIVQFHSENSEVMHQPVITEHGRNRNQQASDGRYQGRSDTRSHGGEIGASSLGGGGGNAAEGGHDPPNRAEQSEKGGTADGNGEQDQAGFQAESLPGDGAFEESLDMFHRFEADVGSSTATGGDPAAEESVEFDATVLIDGEQRAAIDIESSIVNTQNRLLIAKLITEMPVQPFCPAHLECFLRHGGPSKDRKDPEDDDDDLGFNGCLGPDVEQFVLAGGGKRSWREIHL